jgi:type IV pilus assembly protein PilA
MINKLRVRAQGESGFTLVELLVVMLILGLLAAIAIPAFFNQRDKARDSDAKSGVRTAQTAIETYNTDHDGTYAGADAAALIAIEPTLADANLTTVTPEDDTGYVLTATSETGNTFTIDRDGGNVIFPCATASDAGCPSNGYWAGEPPPAP